VQAHASVEDVATHEKTQGQKQAAAAAREHPCHQSHECWLHALAGHTASNGRVAGGGQQLHPLLCPFPGPLNSAWRQHQHQQQQQQQLTPWLSLTASQPQPQWLQYQQPRPQPSFQQHQLQHNNIPVQPRSHPQLQQLHQLQHQSFRHSGLIHDLTLNMPVAGFSHPANAPTPHMTQQTGVPTVTQVTLLLLVSILRVNLFALSERHAKLLMSCCLTALSCHARV